MGSKDGGGYDTSGMERATEKATELQREIYEKTREDIQPWYQVGAAGMGKLGDLLGLTGGSIKSRDQIYRELKPQFTSMQQTGAAGNQFIDEFGNVVYMDSPESVGAYKNLIAGGDSQGELARANQIIAMSQAGDYTDADLENFGLKRIGGTPEREFIDYEALNAAVEERLAGQGETPEGYGSLLERFNLDKFETDPSYTFRQEEAQNALERAMAAQGVTLGGGGYGEINPQVARALEEQSQNLASQEYMNAYNRYNIDQQNIFNRLMGVSGMGQGAAGQLAGAGQSYATNVGNLQTGLASAQANAAAARASQPSMFGQILGAGAQLAGSYFSDIRLKKNIKLVGVEGGHNIYEFDYLDGSGRYKGVMAHEVAEIAPEAVEEMPNGYLAVDYGKIGIEMERV